MGLTEKKKKFADGLLSGKSEETAFKEAGFLGNKERALNLAFDPQVREYLTKRRMLLRRRAEEDGIVAAKEVVRELCSIAFADMGDYLEYGYLSGEDEEKPYLRLKESRDVVTKNIAEVSVGKDGKVTFKLYSKERALFKLFDLLGLGDDLPEEEESSLLSALRRTSEMVFGEEDEA